MPWLRYGVLAAVLLTGSGTGADADDPAPAPAAPAVPPAAPAEDPWAGDYQLSAFRSRAGVITYGSRRSPTSADKERTAVVEVALRWLAAHQSPDGRWEAAGFDRWCEGKEQAGTKPDGQGAASADVSATGLALSALLTAGHTHLGGPYATNVRRGLEHLLKVQDAKVWFGPRTEPADRYGHARAALCLQARGL